jgi:hypothetical protein
MKKEHENMILTPDELRERYELEDGPPRLLRAPTLLEIRKERIESGFYLPYGPEREARQVEWCWKTLRNLNSGTRKQRRRELEMKISEDYWSAKPPMSPIQGKDFGFIFKN